MTQTKKLSWDSFMLIKVTDYAEQLMAGQVYMQPLSYFRNEEGKNAPMNDFIEGTFGQFKFEDLPVLEEDKYEIESEIEKLKACGVNNIRCVMDPSEKTGNLKLFCLYMLSADSKNKIVSLPDNRLRDFGGKEAVIIHNWYEFGNRISKAISKKGEFGYEKIRYKKVSDEGYWGVGVKINWFEWQHEFRFWCLEDITTTTPLTLEIGDISDIAIKISVDDLLDREKFMTIFAEDEYSGYVESNIPSFVEEDITVMLYKKMFQENLLLRKQNPVANDLFSDVQKYISEDKDSALLSMKEYYLASQVEPYKTNCLPIIVALADTYWRLAEDYFCLKEYTKASYYMWKFFICAYRANLKIRKDVDKKTVEMQKQCGATWETDVQCKLAFWEFYFYSNKDK